MKTKLLFSACLLSANFVLAQSFVKLDINNIKMGFNSTGDHLEQALTLTNGTQTPYGTIPGIGNLWIGGLDNNGVIHISAQTYRQGGSDFWSGAMDTTSVSCITSQNTFYNKVWKINKTTIDSFRMGQFSVIPTSITTWPGNGNLAAGEAHYMAPFVDVDGDGTYNYLVGDYPKIRGDQALWFVYNDSLAGQQHGETHGRSMGIEIRVMAYEVLCSSDSALPNSVFVHYDIINRSHNQYDSTYVGIWNDFDSPSLFQDEIGSDSLEDNFYFYDTSNAIGLVMLNKSMAGSIGYRNNFNAYGNPNSPDDFYGYLKQEFLDSTHLTYGGNGYGGTSPTNFVYTGDPFSGTGWLSLPQSSTDYRVIGSTAPFTFTQSQVFSLDMAYVFAHDGASPFNCVPIMKQRMQSIKTYYTTDQTPCSNNITSIATEYPSSNSIEVFPNPATSNITLHSSFEKQQSYFIYDIAGQLVMNGFTTGVSTVLDIQNLKPGMYFLKVGSDENIQSLRFIKTKD